MFSWLNTEALPAWLQAFAGIVALGISVWAVLHANAAEKRRDKLKARGIAVAIFPELLKLDDTIENARSTLERLKSNPRVLVGQAIAATVAGGQIAIPPMVDRNVDGLYLLGEPAGPSCLQLISILLQYNALVIDVASRMMVMNADQWKEGIEHLESHLTLVAAVVAKCQSAVRPIHDAVRG